MSARYNAILIATLAIFFATPSFAQSGYVSCLEKNVNFYGMYCHTTEDVLKASRASCRKEAANMFKELDPSDQASMVSKYLDVMDETATKILLDFRIKNKIDCGQFNDSATRDMIDALEKR